MGGWMDREKEKQGFGPAIGCHRMGEKGEDDSGRKGRACVERGSGGEGDRQ